MAAPVIHIGDATIQTTVEQKTYPSLHIMDHTGAVYHVAVRAQDEQLATGTETLVYEQSTINTCETVTLDAGLYRAELRGGSGGLPARCSAGMGTVAQLGVINTTIIKLDVSSTIYTFRGGDGNNSGAINKHQFPGGGASGVDSLIVLPTRTIRATGGVPVQCTAQALDAFPSGGWSPQGHCIGGAANSNGGRGVWGTPVAGGCGGGGGGAPNGTGGAAAKNTTAGANATSTGGGNGGDATNPNGDSKTSNIGHGGAGGANVTWQCGGQTITSYGGGGGGGMCAGVMTKNCNQNGSWCYSDCADGGDGGSGSTGTSTDSYVKIYRIG